MRRPYVTLSLLQIDALIQKAVLRQDGALVRELGQELQHRKTPAANLLRQRFQAVPGEKLVAALSDGPPGRGHVRSTPNPNDGSSKPSRGRRRLTIVSHLQATPTAEQSAAIDAFRKGGSLKINAFAGSGKTSILQMLAHATARRGQYIAFNRAIVADAKAKFPRHVSCSTVHALAFKAIPAAFKSSRDKITGRVNAHRVVELLNLESDWLVDGQHMLKPLSQAALILKTLQRFAQSADQEPLGHHVPRIGSLLTAPPRTIKAVEGFAVMWAKQLWRRMLDPADPTPLGFDGFVKMWALSEPCVPADFILVDEAQDINPVALAVLTEQSAQMIYVGDRYQQIYEWRGAVNAMDMIRTDASASLTKSFRFGPAIAGAASRLLGLLGETDQISGNPEIGSRIGFTEPCCILSRTNAAAMSEIIEALDRNQRPHLVGNGKELMDMLRGVRDLKCGEPSSVAEFFGFQNWDEVVAFAKGEEGEHLATFVNLVESRGERQLIWALNHTVSEKHSDVVISTAHKAKGREWTKVRLTDDFLTSLPRNPGENGATTHDPAELRLFYVAMTRARQELQISRSLLSALGVVASE